MNIVTCDLRISLTLPADSTASSVPGKQHNDPSLRNCMLNHFPGYFELHVMLAFEMRSQFFLVAVSLVLCHECLRGFLATRGGLFQLVDVTNEHPSCTLMSVRLHSEEVYGCRLGNHSRVDSHTECGLQDCCKPAQSKAEEGPSLAPYQTSYCIYTACCLCELLLSPSTGFQKLRWAHHFHVQK